MRIIVANEPRSYREVIAAAVQALRPQLEVVLGEPESLEHDMARLAPQMVVCSRLGATTQHTPITWVMLYPEGKTEALISIDGSATAVNDLEFDRLLSIIDETEYLIGKR